MVAAEAAKFLDIKRTNLMQYTNLINYLIYSATLLWRRQPPPALDKEVFIIDASKPRTENNPQYSKTDHLGPIFGINLESLENGLLYAYFSDKVTLFGIFDTPALRSCKAALKLDNKKRL